MRQSHRSALRTPAALACALLLAAPGAASAQQPMWELDLSDQLMEQKSCELDYMTGVIEREVDGKPVVIGRAHCKDGRAFDVSRSDEFEDFELKACDIVAC